MYKKMNSLWPLVFAFVRQYEQHCQPVVCQEICPLGQIEGTAFTLKALRDFNP